LRILEGKPQRAVSAHGDAADGPARARSQQTESFLHLRDKLTNEKILVSRFAVFGVDVKRISRLRRDDHKLGETFLLPGIGDYVPSACGNQKRLVASQAMQEVEHRKLLRPLCIVAGRQKCAVPNR